MVGKGTPVAVTVIASHTEQLRRGWRNKSQRRRGGMAGVKMGVWLGDWSPSCSRTPHQDPITLSSDQAVVGRRAHVRASQSPPHDGRAHRTIEERGEEDKREEEEWPATGISFLFWRKPQPHPFHLRKCGKHYFEVVAFGVSKID